LFLHTKLQAFKLSQRLIANVVLFILSFLATGYNRWLDRSSKVFEWTQFPSEWLWFRQ